MAKKQPLYPHIPGGGSKVQTGEAVLQEMRTVKSGAIRKVGEAASEFSAAAIKLEDYIEANKADNALREPIIFIKLNAVLDNFNALASQLDVIYTMNKEK